MSRYVLFCFIIFIGVIAREARAAALSRFAEVPVRPGASYLNEVDVGKPRPIPGLRPIQSILESGYSAETSVNEDKLRKLLAIYGIDIDTNQIRGKNAEKKFRDQYEVDLNKDDQVKKDHAYLLGDETHLIDKEVPVDKTTA